MGLFKNRRTVFLSLFVLVNTAQFFGTPIPSHCEYDKECLIELPGSLCADGTSSYYTLTARKDAKNILVYLQGGGACWDSGSCKNGMATTLTRVAPNNDWNNGKGIFNNKDKANPFAGKYNIVTIPYCTADVFIGSNEVDYGSPTSPFKIKHNGFKNVELAFESIKATYTEPEKVVLMGGSAGGIGAFYHMSTLDRVYDRAKKYVISDAGTPFKPPYISATKYKIILKNWGAAKTLPNDPAVLGHQPDNFGDVIEYNTKKFPNIRYGLVSTYRDYVMTFFSVSIGSSSPFTAVRDILINVADKNIGKDSPSQKVFYIDGSSHTQAQGDLATIVSLGQNLGQWMSSMIDEKEGWANVRPDLNHQIKSNLDIGEPQPKNLKELNEWKLRLEN